MDPDRLLADKLRRREPGALAEVYRIHGTRVYRLCLRILGHAADAEDAAQEVFLKLTMHSASFDGRASLWTWIHRIAVNHCLHHLEKERLRTPAGRPPDEALETNSADSPLERSAQWEAKERLEKLLRRLSDEHRVVLVLREIEALSYREIAEALEIPVGTVMSRLARAREQLTALARPRQAIRIHAPPSSPRCSLT